MTVKTLLIEYDDADGDVMGGYPLHAPAVEVVRCRDCKHCVTTIWQYGWERTEYECDLLLDFGGTPLTIALDGFCAWGERGEP